MCDKTFIAEKKKKNKNKIKGMISMRIVIPSYSIQHVASMFVPNFKILGAVVPEKSVRKKNRAKEKWTIKER